MPRPLKILFMPAQCTTFFSTILDFRPLGGTETGIIRMSNELYSMGHDVSIFQNTEYPPNVNGPKYISARELDSMGEFDATIIIRGWNELFKPLKSKKFFLWATDAYRSLKTYGLGDKRVVDKLDGLLLLSRWHQETICRSSGFPIDKTWIINNGVYPDYFAGTEIRSPKRLIYSSAPDRGLAYMPVIFTELKKRHPELEFHVFSSLDKYFTGWTSGYKPSESSSLYEQLKKIPGCYMHGSVLQRELAREYMKSSIMTYPSNFEETSCISAIEAMAGGAAIVTSDLGALKETIQGAGIFIGLEPGTDAYIQAFIEETDKLLKDPKKMQELSTAGLKRAKQLTWAHSAKNLADYLINFHHLAQ